MAATLINKAGGSTKVNGYIQYSLTFTYQVLASRKFGINTILKWPGIPQAGSLALIEGQSLWVDSPTCMLPNPQEDRWFVTVPYTNQTSTFERDVQGNPVEEPTEAVKQVSVDWVDTEEPVNNARFRGWTYQAPEMEGGIPLTLNNAWTKNGPVTNSAGEPIEVMRKKRVKMITVRRVSRDWQTSWETYQNAINTDEVQIIERDKDGVRATHTFNPYTLRMSISTPNEWKDGRLYFRPAFNMEYNEKTWIHAEVDRGTKRRAFEGQLKPEDKDGNTTYTVADLEKLNIYGTTTNGVKAGFASIMTDNGKVAIGEPVLFSGMGHELTIDPLITEPVFGNWDVELNLKPYGPLNL